MLNPAFFIVGCPRSGTTLLERLLHAHGDVAVVHESHFITRFQKKGIGVDRQGWITPELVTRLVEEPRFARFGVTGAELEELLANRQPLHFAALISELFERFGRREGKAVVGDKTTGPYLRNLPILHGLFPEARIIHLIRDGREVALSMLNWPKAHRAAGRQPMWQQNPLATTALWWRWQVHRGRADGERIGTAHYREVLHDDLVQHTAETCANLCGFLGVRYDAAMLAFNAGRENLNEAPYSANRAWLSPTPGLRNWRKQMAPADVELFEALAGDLLEQLGFARAFPTISPGVLVEAEGFRRQWETVHGVAT